MKLELCPWDHQKAWKRVGEKIVMLQCDSMLFKILCQHPLRLKSPAWEGKCVQHFPRHWSRPLAHSSRLCLWVILPFSCSMGDKILSRIQLSYPQALTQGWGADIPLVFQVQTQWNQNSFQVMWRGESSCRWAWPTSVECHHQPSIVHDTRFLSYKITHWKAQL